MQLLLFADTSTESCSIFIAENSNIIFSISDSRKLRHSQKLLAGIDNILKNTGHKIEEIEYFAAPAGPGSFTGIRIALATVKSFCYALNRKLITLNNLETQAVSFKNHYKDNSKIFSLLPAGNDMYYYSMFNFDKGIFKPERIDSLININKLPELISSAGAYSKTLVTSDKKLIESLQNGNIYESLFFIDANTVSLDNINKLLTEKIRQLDFTDALNAAPLYIKKSDAEYLKDKRK